MPRDPETCRYRNVASDQAVSCGLLAEISGVRDPRQLLVPDGACEACCDSFIPTETDPNPVIASLLYRLAEALGEDDVESDDAETLRQIARKHLPIVLPDEEDVVDDLQRYHVPVGVTADDLERVIPICHDVTSSPASWAIGVTTSPRRRPTLETSLASCQDCGWGDVHVFADGDVPLPDPDRMFRVTRRGSPSGAWQAWRLALAELISRNPRADAILIFQDDALFPATPALLPYLEKALWPSGGDCIVSLYACTDYTTGRNGWAALPLPWLYGAVAWVFPMEIALRLQTAINAGALEQMRTTAGIDTRVGRWAWAEEIPVWFPTPSLVQHIGQVSAVWESSRAVGLRRASRFVLDELANGAT